MAAINDLINQIPDIALRERIQQEVNKLNKQKKFGLVWEDHFPEATLLYDMPVKRGKIVAIKGGDINDLYSVQKIDGSQAICVRKADQETVSLAVESLVCVAQFGEAIYPYLKPIDTVCNAPESDLWHTLIEADNYHALQLLEYIYAGKVDCIYIDPPYNTGAKDWKYNNDYVDGSDNYRHSKWLSMMEKRLRIAKRLLNPDNSVLIVTIDEKEQAHLGCLLEELFSSARIQMVSSVINPSGVARIGEFSRSDEYLYFIKIGSAAPAPLPLSNEWGLSNSAKKDSELDAPTWRTLRRRGSNDLRKDRPNLFYPIYIEEETGKILRCGESLPIGIDRSTVVSENTSVSVVWPMKPGDVEGRWQLGQAETMDRLEKGFVKTVSKNKYGWIPVYLAKGEEDRIRGGQYRIVERSGANNEVVLEAQSADRQFVPSTQWRIPSHNARENGSVLLNSIIGPQKFSFPKSLYAVHDAVKFFLSNKPDALILDFFAGSGTTLHAINLLNATDCGHRRCILVTNNEVSNDEAKELSEQGYYPGDPEWERLGIARYVTWPRTVCSIKGHDINGLPLKGNYVGSDLPLSDGFKTNAAFFKLGFLDKTAVLLGFNCKEMLPTLWLKAGAHGPCPCTAVDDDMLILPTNRFAVLLNENKYSVFEAELIKHPEIQTVYINTDYEVNFQAMTRNLHVEKTYQLYRDYTDHFRLNHGRN